MQPIRWYFGILMVGTAACGFASGAMVGVRWAKSQVTAVVLVKPGIVGFEPTEGSSVGNIWHKDEVKPVLLVKPSSDGFAPIEGSTIGNSWKREDVIPVTLTEPSADGFSPIELGNNASGESGPEPPTQAVIDSQISGTFNGWDGDTVIRLTNGQIWKQDSYHYEYHYAFMPKVLIYKAGSSFKAKVEGTEEAVPVSRLK